jgi:tetratricopeptide (TPR) repeat protein
MKRSRQRHGPAKSPRDRDSARVSFFWPAIAIFVVAFVVRAIHIYHIRDAPFFNVLMGDSRAYDEWAQQIARGEWLGRDVFYQAPLYPYFLGAIYSVAGHDLIVVRVVQATVGSLACALLGLAGWRLFSTRAGVIAGLMLALYAPAIFFDALIQKSVVDVFFVCLFLALLARIVVEPEKPRFWLWLGFVTGCLSLVRENALVFAGVIMLWTLARGPRSIRQRGSTAAVFLLGVTLVVLPVAVRNKVVGGEFHLTTAQFGPNFYIGNNPLADGTYMSLRFGRGAPEYERQDATALAEHAVGRRLTPAEVSSYWTRRALAYITSQPGEWLKLLGRKAALVWNASEMLDTESQGSHAEWSAPLRLAGFVGHFGVLVPLAFVGLWATWPQRRRLSILYGLAVAYAGSVVMFYVFARYRYPLVPFLVLFAAAGLATVRQTFGARSRTHVIAMVTALGAVAVFTNWPLLSADLMRAITEHNLGSALQEQGSLEEAAAHYRRAIAIRPDYAPAHNNIGVVLRAQGRLDEAIAQYEQALRLRADYPNAHYNLANALLVQGKHDAAIAHFRAALESTPGSVEAHTNLAVALEARGKLDEAIDHFRVAASLDAGSAQTRENLANALLARGASLLESGKPREGMQELRAALALMPSSVEAHNNLGIALASQGSLDEAISHFQRALELRPEFEDARRNLATALRANR